jgi:hypothetical protein
VTDATGHLPYWTIEQLAEGSLSHAETTLAQLHLRACTRCAQELNGARAVVAALEAMPMASPSAGFADAVMARVQIAPIAMKAPAPSMAKRGSWKSRRLAAMAAVAVLMLPMLAVTGAFAAMGALWGVVRGWAGEVSWNLFSEGTEVLIRTGMFQWGSDVLGSIPGPSAGGVPVLLLLLAAMVPVSAWAMARLLRAPMTGLTHA